MVVAVRRRTRRVPALELTPSLTTSSDAASDGTRNNITAEPLHTTRENWKGVDGKQLQSVSESIATPSQVTFGVKEACWRVGGEAEKMKLEGEEAPPPSNCN